MGAKTQQSLSVDMLVLLPWMNNPHLRTCRARPAVGSQIWCARRAGIRWRLIVFSVPCSHIETSLNPPGECFRIVSCQIDSWALLCLVWFFVHTSYSLLRNLKRPFHLVEWRTTDQGFPGSIRAFTVGACFRRIVVGLFVIISSRNTVSRVVLIAYYLIVFFVN